VLITNLVSFFLHFQNSFICNFEDFSLKLLNTEEVVIAYDPQGPTLHYVRISLILV
jgi:hypothetical protein